MTVPRLDIPDTARLIRARNAMLDHLLSFRCEVNGSIAGIEQGIGELIAASIEAAFPVMLKQAAGFNTDRERRD